MLRTYKYRIYPTKAQETSLNKMLEECRWLYNKILSVRKDTYEQKGESLGLYDTQSMIPAWKNEHSSLKLVNSQVLQNVNVRVDLAFKAFFRRAKSGESPGYPRFKGYGRYDSMTFPQVGEKGCAKIYGATLILSKLGNVKINLHRDLCGKPKTVTINRSSTDKWFALVSCECESVPLPESEKFAGIDVGIQSFATLSNGEKIDNPRFFKNEQDSLAKAQRRMGRLAQNTPERIKARKVVSRIHERIANKRTDFSHKQSRRLVNTYGILVFEKLSVASMIRNRTQVFGKRLNKSIADVAWSQLAQFTAYKAEDAGRLFLQVDPRNTSKKCSRCGSIVNKDLSIRVHNCPHCGLVLDRDHNAAINILALGLQSVNTGSPDEVVEASQP